MIVETTGRTIAEIFAADGEEEFVASRRTSCASALAARRMLSLGGGAVTTAGRARGVGRPHRHLSGDQCGRGRPAHRRRHGAPAAGRRRPGEKFTALMTSVSRSTGGSRRCGSTPTGAIRCGGAPHRGPARELQRVAPAACSAAVPVASQSDDLDTGTDHRGAPVARGTGSQESGDDTRAEPVTVEVSSTSRTR